MASTFAGLSLFDSGPHRFSIRGVGRHWLDPDQGQNSAAQTWDRAVRELQVEQRGRLIGADEADLWSQVDAIRAQAELPRTGTLVDHSGRSWPGLTMLRFEPEDRVDRGRVVSVGYRVVYREV